MAYLGNAPARSFISFERQVFTIVNSQTAYALSHSVTNENDIRLVVNNVVQEPGSGKAYTATGTALTLSAALTNGTDEMYCVFLGRATATSAPGAGSIGTVQLADNATTLAKMASGTDGNIISYDTSGNPVAVATGSAGQFLKSAGAGAVPSFATIPAGGVNTPYFHAYSLSGQTLNNATETKKTFTNVTESASGVFDLSNDKFTVATAGKYFLTFNLYGYDTGNHIRRLDIWMKKGGSQKVKFSWNFTNDVGGRDFSIGNSFIMDLSVNDYIEMYVYQGTGDSGSIELRGSSSEQSCYFSGFKLIE